VTIRRLPGAAATSRAWQCTGHGCRGDRAARYPPPFPGPGPTPGHSQGSSGQNGDLTVASVSRGQSGPNRGSPSNTSISRRDVPTTRGRPHGRQRTAHGPGPGRGRTKARVPDRTRNAPSHRLPGRPRRPLRATQRRPYQHSQGQQDRHSSGNGLGLLPPHAGRACHGEPLGTKPPHAKGRSPMGAPAPFPPPPFTRGTAKGGDYSGA